MADCDEVIRKMNKKAAAIFLLIPEEFQKTMDWLDSYKEEIRAKIKEVQSENYNIPILPKAPKQKIVERPTRTSSSSIDEDHNSSKAENKTTNITTSSLNASGKQKRNASKLAEQKIHVQANQSLKIKMRNPGPDNNVLSNVSNNTIIVNIKSEKKSASPKQEPVPQIELIPDQNNVKKENMPPPVYKPKRGRRKIKKEVETSDSENDCMRVTRSKKNTKSITKSKTKVESKTTSESKIQRDSDIILQEVQVPIVIINDSDTEDVTSLFNSEVENNSEDSNSVDVPLINQKTKKKTKKQLKTKDNNKDKEKIKEKSKANEDALPVIYKHNEIRKDINNENISEKSFVPEESNKLLNCTRIIEKPAPTLNETHVLQKMNETIALAKNNAIADKTIVLTPRENEYQWKKADVPLPVDNVLTDDDEPIVHAQKRIKTKQMFSQYSNSPVKKRVAAFEKLVTNDAITLPARVTRAKTKNMENIKEQISSESTAYRIPSAKSKYFTPTAINKLPSLIPKSDTKAYLQRTVAINASNVLPIKSATVVKPSRAEMQLRREEDQKKRVEKEEEARQKREAMMQAKAEEQRQKREEKQMKVQKAREEIEREKEKKLRQMIQEKEEDQQKKREWQTKKLAEIKERKEAEEQIKQLKLREKEQQRQLEEKHRKKLAMKPPPLPTDDCEDSDSSSETTNAKRTVYQKPMWAQSYYLGRTLMLQSRIPKTLIETLYQMEATTPDLREIFETVDERILRRNSSAVWRTPPRYSTLPKF